MRLEHREHMGTSDLKAGLDETYQKPDGLPAETLPASPRALTPAERQRRHRAKKKEQASAFGMTAAANLLPENMRLVRQLEATTLQLAEHKQKAEKSAAQVRQLQRDLQAAGQRLQDARACLSGLLPRLTVANRQVLRHALKEAGFVAWLDSG